MTDTTTEGPAQSAGDELSLFLGQQYGRSLELCVNEQYDGGAHAIDIETQGFSDLNGAIPAPYTLDPTEATMLAEVLLVFAATEVDRSPSETLDRVHENVTSNIESGGSDD